MIEQVAWLYVNVLEPGGKALMVLLAVLLALNVVHFIRDPKAKETLVKSILGSFMTFLKWSLTMTGKVLRGSVIMLLNVIKVIFAAVRDFFGSKI